MKNLKPNDPEFTAKAIGEKEWGSPDGEIGQEDLKAYEEMEAFASLLGRELKQKKASDKLSDAQFNAIKAQSNKDKRANVLPFPKLYWVSGIAAALVVTLIIPFMKEVLEPAMDGTGDENAVNEIELLRPQSPKPETEMEMAGSVQDSPSPNNGFQKDEKKHFDSYSSMENRSLMKADGEAFFMTGSKIKEREAAPVTVGLSAPEPKSMLLAMRSSEPARMKTVSREGYAHVESAEFRSVSDHPLSTFSIDVDTASYSNVRRFLRNDNLPPAGAVRIEELINYFDYPSYKEPVNGKPFSVDIASMKSPWARNHELVRVALQSGEIPETERQDANLVFLVDVSGSMNHANKLPLVQYSLNKVVEQMGANDRIAVVVYAGNSGLALPSTTANNTETIQFAIQNLRAGGSTNGGAGIELAYEVAQMHFIEGGINRVILCTDGDFNVGQSSDDALVQLIEKKRESGVFFSILGFGSGNYQDAKMELLSNKGNGNFAYIDTEAEARKQLVGNLLGMLTCVAKDVKIQVEFNPAYVQSYRLIGYENRTLAKEDFNDDRKDAGEIGGGHSVTALYEVVPVGEKIVHSSEVDPLKYQVQAVEKETSIPGSFQGEWLNVKVRYKAPDEDTSVKFEVPFQYSENAEMGSASLADLSFAATVAGFGMKLRGDSMVDDLQWQELQTLLRDSLKHYSDRDREEFLDLLSKAEYLSDSGAE